MKSLSPNAQEFIPFKTSNTLSTTTIGNNNLPLIIINSDVKPSVPPISAYNANPIIHGYMSQQQYITYHSSGFDQQPPASLQPASQTVLTFNNMAELNNYIYHQKQKNTPYHQPSPIRFVQPLPLAIPSSQLTMPNISPTHAVSHDSIEIPHRQHHPHSTSIIPILAATSANASPPAAFYAFTTVPPPSQTVPVINAADFSIDPNGLMITHHQQQSQHHHFSSQDSTVHYNTKIPSNKMNHQMPKRTHINNNNKFFMDKKQIINKEKTTNFEINSDQDWPILNANKVCTFQSDLLASNKKSVNIVKKEGDNDDTIHETADILLANLEPKKPYIEDENKLKKVIKNVDFIKKTVEQHYNYTEGKFSFKDAVLSVPKPLPIINKTTATATFDNVSNQEIKSKKKKQL